MDTGVFIRQDNLKSITDAIKGLTLNEVFVGYPDNGAARTEQGAPTNAYIAFIQEHGSPVKNIPARPFMVPGIRAVQTRVVALLEQAAVFALSGERDKYMQRLNQVGFIGVQGVQRAITMGQGWLPLAQRTLAARRRRGFRGTHPLIETNQLRSHVTYVIRRKTVRPFTFVDDSFIMQQIRRAP